MRLPALFRTTAFKLTAIFLAVFFVFSLMIAALVTFQAKRILRAQLTETISEDIAALSNQFSRGGIRALVAHVDRRSRQPGSGVFVVMNFQGIALTGNVSKLPTGFLNLDRSKLQPLPYLRRGINGEEEEHFALARIIKLPAGFFVVVGRDVGEQDRFKDVVFSFLALTVIAMIVLALLSWYFVARHVLRRIDNVSASSQKIIDGDLSERLAMDGTGDEFDRLAENVNAMLDRIETLMDGLKQVSDNIAHDLKTPLTRMRNRVESALNSNNKQTYHEALEGTIVESNNLIKTFDALLSIARVEAGSAVQMQEITTLPTLVTDICELYEPTAEAANIVLEMNVPDKASTIIGNHELIAQGLANLIDNAIKYAPSSSQISVSMQQMNKAIIIKVRDWGQGIPDADKDRVTKRFVRLEKSRTEEGSGLGLSLVAAVAKLHNGALKLEDANPGLTVSLMFPIKE